MAANPIVEALGELLAVLDELKIGYYAGGSVASSVHGVPRFTQDIDLVADLMSEKVEQLCAKLSAHFYADAPQMREALRFGRLPTGALTPSESGQPPSPAALDPRFMLNISEPGTTARLVISGRSYLP